MAFYSRYNKPPPAVLDFEYADKDGVLHKVKDFAHQEFKDECDINLIMASALKSGVFPPALKVGRYGDFSEVGEYRDALETVAVAQAQFEGLPSRARDKFGNDPAKFLEWLRTASLKEANDLGLLSDEASKRILEAAQPPPPLKTP